MLPLSFQRLHRTPRRSLFLDGVFYKLWNMARSCQINVKKITVRAVCYTYIKGKKLCKLYTKAFILVLNTNQTVETKGTNERE